MENTEAPMSFVETLEDGQTECPLSQPEVVVVVVPSGCVTVLRHFQCEQRGPHLCLFKGTLSVCVKVQANGLTLALCHID